MKTEPRIGGKSGREQTAAKIAKTSPEDEEIMETMTVVGYHLS